jgi:PPOX class probable F420-dependent enzyme
VPMTPEEIDAFLADARLCHFATVDGEGRPRVRPLWFLWKGGEFWFTTRMEARHTGRDLASSPQVALSVASEDRPYRAVIAHGRPEVMAPSEDLLLGIATRYGDPEGKRWAARASQEPDRVIMRMRPDTLLTWDYSREGTDSPKRTEVR